MIRQLAETQRREATQLTSGCSAKNVRTLFRKLRNDRLSWRYPAGTVAHSKTYGQIHHHKRRGAPSPPRLLAPIQNISRSVDRGLSPACHRHSHGLLRPALGGGPDRQYAGGPPGDICGIYRLVPLDLWRHLAPRRGSVAHRLALSDQARDSRLE